MDMRGVPLAAEYASVMSDSETEYSQGGDRVVRLKIEAALSNADGTALAEIVQKGFSELAVSSGGRVFEY